MHTFNVYLSKRFEKYETKKQEIISHLTEYGYKLVEGDGDLTIVLGGDGSLLHAVNFHNYKGKFILINCGTLGYYADYDVNELEEFYQDVKRGECVLESHRLLELNDGEKNYLAANDIMIGSAIKTLYVKVLINGEDFMCVASSGVLLSTSFGSTGYAHSLGGSIMVGDNGFALNLLAPVHNKIYHTFVSSLVLEDQDEVTIEVINSDAFEVATDMIDVSTESRKFTIKKSDVCFSLVHYKKFNAYNRIRKSFITD